MLDVTQQQIPGLQHGKPWLQILGFCSGVGERWLPEQILTVVSTLSTWGSRAHWPPRPSSLILNFQAFADLLSGRPAWVHSLEPLLSSCVTLRKLLDVSVPLAPHLENADNNIYLIDLLCGFNITCLAE